MSTGMTEYGVPMLWVLFKSKNTSALKLNIRLNITPINYIFFSLIRSADISSE